MKLGPLLRANSYLQIERPPVLWEVEAENIRVVPVLGEMIVLGLGRGNEVEQLTLNVSNVTVEPDPLYPHRLPAPGDYVALTIKGAGDWRPEWIWSPRSRGAKTIYRNIEDGLDASGAAYAYSRAFKDNGSVTAFFRRAQYLGV